MSVSRDGPLSLRAHHLLCAFGFRGLGYSDAFVANMRRIVDAFFAGAARVQVTDRCDDICAACPHRSDGECHSRPGSEGRIRQKDRRALETLGLEVNQVRPAGALARLVAERIDGPALARICGRCRWLPRGYCEEGLSRRRQGAPSRAARPSGA